ncbi:MAG: C2H2-type zinc finger protein [Sedimenticola sp.]
MDAESGDNKRKRKPDLSDNGKKLKATTTFKCKICQSTFTIRDSYKRHIKSHTAKFNCETCKDSFNRLDNLKRHQRRHTRADNQRTSRHDLAVRDQQRGKAATAAEIVSADVKCDVCNNAFPTNHDMTQHRRGHFCGYKHCQLSYNCNHCQESFADYLTLFNHVNDNHPLPDVNRNSTSRAGGNIQQHSSNDDTALEGLVNIHRIYPIKEEKYDLLPFFINIKQQVINHLSNQCRKLNSIKWYMTVHTQLLRESEEGIQETVDTFFRSNTKILLLPDDDNADHMLNEAYQKQFKSFDEFLRRGSGWKLKNVTKMEINTVKYSPFRGSSYFEMPRNIRKCKGVVNIKNKDTKCCIWSVLAALHPARHNPQRVNNYKRYETNINMTGINLPVSACDKTFRKFENQNNISINVFGFEKGVAFPIYMTRLKACVNRVDLLYMKRGEKGHYCCIKNLNRFLCHTKGNSRAYRYCRFCLQGFTSARVLTKHLQYCENHECQHTTFPEEGKNDKLKFKEYWKQLRIGFVIYADFETYCQPVDTCVPDSDQSSTTKITNLEPNSFGYKVVCANEEFSRPTVIFRGENASEKFIECMLVEEERIKNIYKNPKPLNMSNEDERLFNASRKCHVCQKYFKKAHIKVRDHCHLTGRFRGAAHADCNLKYKQPKFLPILLHNLRNFDGHIICQAIGKFKHLNINCIPNNMEKYVSFSLGRLRFIDTYQFVNASLENLVSNLAMDGLDHFKHFRKEFTDISEAELLLRKNVYPYNYCDSSQRFDETSLPAREAFYNQLRKSNISDKDYQHAQTVWNAFGMNTFGEYHDLYLRTDVLLLADCFERFRDTCFEYYDLDACWFLTSPGLSWAASLKMTKCCLTLLSDPTMYLFFEKAVRGGVSMISKRFARSNNKYIPDEYDNGEANKFILYQDCTNLYGKSVSMYLPTGEMQWATTAEIEEFDIANAPEEGEYGYIIEADLKYPPELHNDHNDYPLCPEHVDVSYDMLSTYNKTLLREPHLFSSTKSTK